MHRRTIARGPAREQTETSTAAIVSLVAGILAWVAVPLLGSLIAIVAGHGALRDISRARGAVGGRGLARAGLVLGWLQLGLVLLALVFGAFVSIAFGLFGLLGLLLVAAIGVAALVGLIGLLSMLFGGLA